MDGDEKVIQTWMVLYGALPEYTGSAPAKASTAQYTYTFNGKWDPELTWVTKSQTYVAQFDSMVNKYTVTWENSDGSLLELDENVSYWTIPEYNGWQPVKPWSGSDEYIFKWWDPAPSAVEWDITYIAQYQEKSKPEEDTWRRRSGWWGHHSITPRDDQHGSAENQLNPEDQHGSAEDQPSAEVLSAYEWARKYNITTMDTIEEADPNGYVRRWHLAKMVVNYMVNVYWKEVPYDITYDCAHWEDDPSEWESPEIKDYAIKACALWVMWINMWNKFNPNDIVTRAEFGAVVSRILWWDKYNIDKPTDKNPFYKNHLKMLKSKWIMTQIDNPIWRQELREWIWVVFRKTTEM